MRTSSALHVANPTVIPDNVATSERCFGEGRGIRRKGGESGEMLWSMMRILRKYWFGEMEECTDREGIGLKGCIGVITEEEVQLPWFGCGTVRKAWKVLHGMRV